MTLEALRIVAAEEMRVGAGELFSALPDTVLRGLMTFISTHIVLGTPNPDGDAALG